MRIDADTRRIDVLVDDAELTRRRAAWIAPPPRHAAGLLAKYAQCVGQADKGAVTHQGGVTWPDDAVIPDGAKREPDPPLRVIPSARWFPMVSYSMGATMLGCFSDFASSFLSIILVSV